MSPTAASDTAPQRGLTRLWKAPAESHELPDLLERVLASRGLLDPELASGFLEPSLRGLHDPSSIPDLDRAAERVLAAVRAGEPVVIYGDYDVDGITATAVLVRTLRAIAPDAPVAPYVPHRVEEGYGLNADALRTLAEGGARVVVSVDCGVTAHEPATVARELGLDLIITDHHNPPATEEDLPGAFAVVHPRHPRSEYPFGELCGAGVAYKLAWRIATLASGSDRVRPDLRELLVHLLSLTTLGVIADLVPLTDENRVIARFGLPIIPNSPFVGLTALVEASGLASGRVDEQDLGFKLAPRLNAIGRLGHAAEAVELMITEDPARAREIAQRLTKLNDERRSVERTIFEHACRLAEEAGMTGPDRRAIVLAHEDWHPGVVGIVCSRLVEKYARPAILLQRQEGVCAGSARSLEGFNLHAAIADCAGHLETFGRHDMAAGLRCRPDRLDAFIEAFLERVGRELTPDDLVRPIRYDTHARLHELTPQAVRSLRKLAPFGMGNPRVKLGVHALRLDAPPAPFGKTGAHLKLRLADPQTGHALQALAWNWAVHADRFHRGMTLDAILTPELNEWRGRESVEPLLHDVRTHSPGE
ncbi:MAG: single-stranded-DNA-specific exonuclease RecJ [Phycisphaerales bacterium JB040]